MRVLIFVKNRGFGFAGFMNDSNETKDTKILAEEQTPVGSITTGDGRNGKFVAGTILANRYRIIGLLGKGGMGEVYKAEDLELSQTVALKFLSESFARDNSALARFRGEVRNARQVAHPNVCRVFDIGEVDGRIIFRWSLLTATIYLRC